jgi:hypothetical protein
MSANSEWVYYLVTTNWLKIRYPEHRAYSEIASKLAAGARAVRKFVSTTK